MAEGLPEPLVKEFAEAMMAGWTEADGGNRDAAREFYRKAEKLNPFGGRIEPDVFLLRHFRGRAKGLVLPPVFTDKRVPTFALGGDSLPTGGKRYTDTVPALHIEKFVGWFNPGFHRKNILADLPHVMVLSTGRCGTVSLCRLLQGSNVVPYHSYWWYVSLVARWEMMCRLIAGEFEGGEPMYDQWVQTRAAEWIGAVSQNQIMVGLNHTDTIFAPIFAALHPLSRFIWLHRSPKAVLKSFIDKKQNLGEYGNQLRPLKYDFPWQWAPTKHDERQCLIWYINFTARFCEAMKRVFRDRVLIVSADRLFERDRGEIGKMLDFMRSNVSVDQAVDHFKVKINEKRHKLS